MALHRECRALTDRAFRSSPVIAGLLLRAAGDLNLDLSRSIMIGDSTKDVSAAQQAGARAILLTESGHRGADGIYQVEPEFRAADLSEAVDLAIREINAGGDGDAG